MKIKTKQTTEIELEISLPYFYKAGRKTVAILKEDLQIHCSWSTDFIIYNTFMEIPSEQSQITAEEFTREYDKTLEYLQSLKSHFFTNK